MATEKRLIEVSPENVKSVLGKVPYYPDEIWKFTAMTERFPTVDAVEVVHGRWIHTEIEDDDWGCVWHKWTCSNCNFSVGHNPNGTNYCSNCGAKMDGDGNG